MSTEAGKPQEQARWEEKFSQMFVIMLNAGKPDSRSRMRLDEERDFLSSAEGLLKSRKRCVISRLLPVWSKKQVGAYSAACFRGQSETAGLQLPPTGSDGGSAGDHRRQCQALPWCALLGHCSEHCRERNQAAAGAQMSSAVPGGCGATAHSSGLCREDEGEGENWA